MEHPEIQIRQNLRKEGYFPEQKDDIVPALAEFLYDNRGKKHEKNRKKFIRKLLEPNQKYIIKFVKEVGFFPINSIEWRYFQQKLELLFLASSYAEVPMIEVSDIISRELYPKVPNYIVSEIQKHITKVIHGHNGIEDKLYPKISREFLYENTEMPEDILGLITDYTKRQNPQANMSLGCVSLKKSRKHKSR